jgi:DNA-binding LacI/PurR family transcriptional regulator
MGDPKPTIADVARAAGVSKGLVSFVFNDRPGVAPQTRARIREAAAAIGWRPSLSARSLSTRTSFALGLVVRRDPRVIAADPFFPAFIAGVEMGLTGEGRILVLSVVPDADTELRTYRRLVADSRVDGVFLTDLRYDDRRLALLAELGLPAVMIGHPDRSSAFPVVNLDDAHGVRQSVAHLVGLGHSRIAYVAGEPQMVHGRRRRDSFVDAMTGAGLHPDRVVDTDFSAAAAAAETHRLLDAASPPTAIVYASDPMAIAGMGVVHQRGLRVPADISITGFDGTDLARHVYPSLTTVVADPAAWGREAARTLLQLIAVAEAPNLELPAAELLVGASTGPPSHADRTPYPAHYKETPCVDAL